MKCGEATAGMIRNFLTKGHWTSENSEFDKLAERLSAVGVLFTNIVSVCDGYIEFCPDHDPSLKEEELVWVWVFRPDLEDQIKEIELRDDLRKLIISYKADNIQEFWDYVSKE